MSAQRVKHGIASKITLKNELTLMTGSFIFEGIEDLLSFKKKTFLSQFVQYTNSLMILFHLKQSVNIYVFLSVYLSFCVAVYL